MATVWFEALKKVLASSETVFSPEIVRYKTLEDGDSLALHIFKPRNMQAGEKGRLLYTSSEEVGS